MPMRKKSSCLLDSYSRRAFLGKAGAGALLAGASGVLSPNLLGANVAPDPGTYQPLDPARKVRIGVVGGGFGASFQWHLHPNCIVQAVSDLRTDRRNGLSCWIICKGCRSRCV